MKRNHSRPHRSKNFDKKLSEKLQMETDLTFQRVMNLIRQQKAVRKQQELVEENRNSVDTIKIKIKQNTVRNNRITFFYQTNKKAEEAR